MRFAFVALPLLLVAGCVSPSSVDPATTPGASTAQPSLAWTDVKVIDAVRAGGEPVIQITPTGTILVAAHPGWTHTRYPPSLNLVTPASGQSYLWRSTDHGATWHAIGLPNAGGVGPRGLGQGVSDPDFAIDTKGRVYLTDLEALAAASVSWSDDDGATWLQGNDVASVFGGAPVDRNWLATHGTDVYFMGNYVAAERVLKSTDGGLTWTHVGDSHCAGDLVTRPSDGAILVGCATGIDVSTDGGRTFTHRKVPGATSNVRSMTEPAVDADGNVYIAWANEEGVFVAGTSDLGETWTTPLRVSRDAGTAIWPWIVAGDAGRVGIAWYHNGSPDGPVKAKGDWFLHAAIVLDAMGSSPSVSSDRAAASPIFRGGICQRGTTCQADPTDAGDRRLGDFFEAAVDAEGRLNIVFSIALDDSVSHAGFVRQTAGPTLRG